MSTLEEIKNAKKLWQNPQFLAETFLNEEYILCIGDMLGKHETYCRLRYWHEDWFVYHDGRYHPVALDTVKANVVAWLQDTNRMVRKPQFGFEMKPTSRLVSDIILNMRAITFIRETCTLNSWLDLQDHGFAIAMANGLLFLDERDGDGKPTFKDHTPNYFTTTQLPYRYDPAATCRLWETFIDDIMQGDGEHVRLLRQWCGYLFRPDLREQKFLLCVGEGANGKGVFFEVLQHLVGRDNCSEVGLAQFDRPFALDAMRGKILNCTAESTHMIEAEGENVLKALVAGDRFMFERKYRLPVSETPTAKIMIATNALPRFNDRTYGTWRRILLVPFEKVVAEEQQVKDLAEELKKQASGIFNWALQGLDDLNHNHGFAKPARHEKMIEEYRKDSDPARAFLLDHYAFYPNAYGLDTREVYQAYTAYCGQSGCCAMNERTFGQQVRRVFPGVDRKNRGARENRHYVYTGLVFREDVPDGTPDVNLGKDEGHIDASSWQ
jgi:P4 family phage/plasmid primase-like protien